MKKSDWILIGAVFLAVSVSAYFFYSGQDRGNLVSIQVDGAENGTYDLGTDQVIEIGETNRLEIREGKAAMVYADCPDQLCVQTASICEVHELIVCMPNRVVVEVLD